MDEWRERAACRGMNPDVFLQGGEKALSICSHCPVREPCLKVAMKTDSVGVWGGTTEIQRASQAPRQETQKRQFLLDGEVEVVWEELQ